MFSPFGLGMLVHVKISGTTSFAKLRTHLLFDLSAGTFQCTVIKHVCYSEKKKKDYLKAWRLVALVDFSCTSVPYEMVGQGNQKIPATPKWFT